MYTLVLNFYLNILTWREHQISNLHLYLITVTISFFTTKQLNLLNKKKKFISPFLPYFNIDGRRETGKAWTEKGDDTLHKDRAGIEPEGRCCKSTVLVHYMLSQVSCWGFLFDYLSWKSPDRARLNNQYRKILQYLFSWYLYRIVTHVSGRVLHREVLAKTQNPKV